MFFLFLVIKNESEIMGAFDSVASCFERYSLPFLGSGQNEVCMCVSPHCNL